MDCHWDNACVLEFIEILQSEPTIWDTKKKSYKNRVVVNDAWERIKNAFALQCTVEDLKRKRNSLMTAYREHLKKIKDTCNGDSDSDDVYKPTWFAFEAMHSFLGPVYEYQTNINVEEFASPSQTQENDSCVTCKRKNVTKEPVLVKKPTDDTTPAVKGRTTCKDIDENDLFTQILAHKLKKMDEEHRLLLTHEINNLVFRYEMRARSRLKRDTGTNSSSINPYASSPSSDIDIKEEISDDWDEQSPEMCRTPVQYKSSHPKHRITNGI